MLTAASNLQSVTPYGPVNRRFDRDARNTINVLKSRRKHVSSINDPTPRATSRRKWRAIVGVTCNWKLLFVVLFFARTENALVYVLFLAVGAVCSSKWNLFWARCSGWKRNGMPEVKGIIPVFFGFSIKKNGFTLFHSLLHLEILFPLTSFPLDDSNESAVVIFNE